jgi:hypothetical protein
MFTGGQKQRVHAMLDSSLAGRNNLSAVSNLVHTCGLLIAGINGPAASLPVIVPNPFADKVKISGIEAGIYNMEVVDLSGRPIILQRSILISSAETTIDLSAIKAQGVYLLTIEKAGSKRSVKIIKAE